MVLSHQSSRTVIARLRVRGGNSDPLATQLRVSSLLSAAELHPPGLAPSAIVCIRSLRDPLPRSLNLQQRSLHPPRAWQQAVISSLEQSIRQAAHPARELVPADSLCVIFADQAELLACMALDWCEHVASTRWWWQSLAKSVQISGSILPAWLAAPEYIPGALQHLEDRGRAVEFARALGEDEARLLLQSVTHRFALHELRAALDSDEEENRDTGRAPRSEIQGRPTAEEQAGARPLAFARRPPAPWRNLLPQSAYSELKLEQQCLLGIVLMLRRAPVVVRSRDFAQQVRGFRRAFMIAERRPSTPPADAVKSSIQQTIQPATKSHQAPTGAKASAQIEQPTSPLAVARDASGLDATASSRTIRAEHVAFQEEMNPDAAPSSQVKQPPLTSKPDISSSPASTSLPARIEQNRNAAEMFTGIGPDERDDALKQGEASSLQAMTPHQSEESPDVIRLIETQIETEFGGLFYLLNLGLFLNLYGDFTTPDESGIPLDVWDFVALLGQRIAGEKVQNDPIWSLLAQLSGRPEEEAPGQYFIPPDEWRLPVEWLASFTTTGEWQWSTNGGRLRVLHPEQFPVLDLPLNVADPVEQLRSEMVAYERDGQQVKLCELREVTGRSDSDTELASSTPLQRWTNRLMPYVRVRLKRALGLERDAEMAHLLCERHAHVFVTTTHVDVMFALRELPVEIRLSGLDRNPGWIPAAGRFVSFHYD